MPSIFISYRRADSRTHAGRIHDRLAAEFGHDAVFKDVDDIPDGAVFPRLLRDMLARTDVLLAIIGPKWASITDKDGHPRLHDPNDFTRMEIEAGLARESCVVIPLLVDGAAMPSRHELPESLHALTERNARVIRDDPDFHADMDRLIRRLRELDQKPAPAPEPPPSAPRPAVQTQSIRISRRWVRIAAAVVLFALLAFGVIMLIEFIDDYFGAPSFDDSVSEGIAALEMMLTQTSIPDYWDASSIDLGVVRRFDDEECGGFTPDDRYAYGPEWIYFVDGDEIVSDPEIPGVVVSPDGTLAAVEDIGLYRLDTGERLYAIGGAPKFSADGRYVASDYLGVYDIANDRLLRNARSSEEYSAISPAGRFIVSRGLQDTGAFVFDLQTGETILEDEDDHGFDDARFSPSGRLLAIAGLGVFEMPSGALLIEGDVGTTFSPQEIHVAGGTVVVDLLADEIVLTFDEARPAFFTPDGRYLAVESEGVYDITTQAMLFSLPDDAEISMSHDGRHVAVQSRGWYSIPDGSITRIDDVGDNDYESPPLFSRDDQVVAFDGVGIYAVETGRRLAAYPHDFVAFGITRPLVLVEIDDEDDEACVMLADRGAFSDAEPLE